MRKRTFILLLLPIVLIIWVIGWTFLWAGDQQQTSQKHQQKDNIHITVQFPDQEKQEITN